MARQRKKHGRDISGILVLDKPVGKSSNGVLQMVKRIFNANKAGHTGNLDVPASGLLPICLGEATKVSAFLLDSNKVYRAQSNLGAVTTTGDAAGQIIKQSRVPEIDESQILQVLEKLTGEIEQIPPMYSALKHEGKRLYKLAYDGIEVARKARPVTIYRLELLSFAANRIEFEVHCSKGTYIRTLSHDIGDALGCGAYIHSLRRLAAGPFHEAQMYTLEQIAAVAEKGMEALDKLLLPMDMALVDMPQISLSKEDASSLSRGQSVAASGLPNQGHVRLYNPEREFIGLGKVSAEARVVPKRLINKPKPGFFA